MNRHLVIFLVTFAVGAVIALVLRTGSHQPYAEHAGHAAAPAPAADPHAGHDMPMPAPTPAPDPHAGHDMPTAPGHAGHEHHASQAPATPTTVNSICAICGMPVNPALPTAEYQGQRIGFGCASCPAKFAAEPAKYGELALKNQVAE